MNLSVEAIRVLGSLVEKERTTPEYYPMSVNGLVNACNQKTNRDPVLALDEPAVARALEALRGAGLAVRSADGGRVVKYAHNLLGKLQLEPAEMALLAELMLRGPQTAGELRGRAERMHHFADIGEVDGALLQLMERTPPLVVRLARQPGHKESRYRQLLGGAAEGEAARGAEAAHGQGDGPPSDGRHVVEAQPSHGDRDAREAREAREARDARDDRIVRLEAEVAELRAEVAALWKEFRSLTLQPD